MNYEACNTAFLKCLIMLQNATFLGIFIRQYFLEKHRTEKWIKRSRCQEIERCWLCRILVWMVDGIIIILVEQESRTTCWVSDDEDEDENDDHLDTQKVSRKVGKWRRRSEEASNATHLHVLRGHFITSCPTTSSFDLSCIQIHLSKSNSWHKREMPCVLLSVEA